MVMPLKDLEIRALKPAGRTYKRADERGLYVEIRPNGAKLWRLKYRFAGKEKCIAFGAFPEVGLAEARRQRDDARRQLREGIDLVRSGAKKSLSPSTTRRIASGRLRASTSR